MKERVSTEWTFHIFKLSATFFLTLMVIVSSTQFFVIFENFDKQKIIDELDINPNFSKNKMQIIGSLLT